MHISIQHAIQTSPYIHFMINNNMRDQEGSQVRIFYYSLYQTIIDTITLTYEKKSLIHNIFVGIHFHVLD
eukprot:c45394_g1_i1 orf=1-207(-)